MFEWRRTRVRQLSLTHNYDPFLGPTAHSSFPKNTTLARVSFSEKPHSLFLQHSSGTLRRVSEGLRPGKKSLFFEGPIWWFYRTGLRPVWTSPGPVLDRPRTTLFRLLKGFADLHAIKGREPDTRESRERSDHGSIAVRVLPDREAWPAPSCPPSMARRARGSTNPIAARARGLRVAPFHHELNVLVRLQLQLTTTTTTPKTTRRRMARMQAALRTRLRSSVRPQLQQQGYRA
jgi:hypothetical protein